MKKTKTPASNTKVTKTKNSSQPADRQKPETRKKEEIQATQPSTIAKNTVLKMVIKKAEADQAYQKAIRSFSTTVKADGFRKGKVPTSKVEEIVGTEKLINQALNQLLPAAYETLITKENKIPLTQPEIKVVSAEIGKDWELEIQIAEKPEIVLGKYQTAVKKALKEADKEITKQEKALADAVKEQEKKDKQAKLEIKREKKETTLSDQQKEDIKLRIIFHHLIESIQPKIAELMIKEDVRRQLDDLVHQLEHHKLKFEDYLKRTGMTFEQLTSQMAATSLASLQVEFILAEIIKEQKIKVADTDYSDYLKKIESNKKVSELDAHMKAHLEHTIARRKVIDYLLSLGK